MTEQTTPARSRTRFARVYGDGSMGIEPAGLDLIEARKRLLDSSDDDDVTIMEVEVTVIRTHGQPKLTAVREHHVACPTCGEIVHVEVPTNGQ